MAATEAITVQVRLFSGIRHMLGGEKQVAVGLPAGATVAALKDEMVRAYPVLEGFMTTYVIAVEEEVQDATHVLHDGDTVDLIPPISGG